MLYPDVVIRGAGIVGRTLALELRRRGCSVLLQTKEQGGAASIAAAGMLAAHDPHNPPALQPLVDLALSLYPDFLARVRDLSGHPVPIHARQVLEPESDGHLGHTLLPAITPNAGNFILREEESLDPRELTMALAAACAAAGIREETISDSTAEDVLLKATRKSSFRPEPTASPSAERRNPHLAPANAGAMHIDCTGAWSPLTRPAKGQMLRVRLPANTLRLSNGGNAVLRTADIYLVPRLDGTTLIGATVEDVGFARTVQPSALAGLRAHAAELVPASSGAPEVESWYGFRPRSADDLPILGQVAPGRFIANGLFRNGILLAPAVAHVMAQLLCGECPDIDLAPFSPRRAAITVIAQT